MDIDVNSYYTMNNGKLVLITGRDPDTGIFEGCLHQNGDVHYLADGTSIDRAFKNIPDWNLKSPQNIDRDFRKDGVKLEAKYLTDQGNTVVMVQSLENMRESYLVGDNGIFYDRYGNPNVIQEYYQERIIGEVIE